MTNKERSWDYLVNHTTLRHVQINNVHAEALEKALNEAEQRGMERAAQISIELPCPMPDKPCHLVVAGAIRVAAKALGSEKGERE